MNRVITVFTLAVLAIITLSSAAWSSPHDPAPIFRMQRSAELPAYPGGGLTPAYGLPANAAGSAVDPTKDLALSGETEVGRGVEAIAPLVSNSPLAAYQWVRNRVIYEPYRGIRRGANGTAWEGRGNDFDQAALLSALLRNMGVPTRFVYGVVRLDANTVANWLGVANARLAVELLKEGGVPYRTDELGGEIIHVEVNHCWLEAYLPFASPGYVGEGEKIWLPLDPSLKETRIKRNADVFPSMSFSEESFFLDYLAEPGSASPEEYFGSLILASLSKMGGLTNLDDAAFTLEIIPDSGSSLPLTISSKMEVLGVLWEEASVPTDYNWRIKLQVFDGVNDTITSPGDIELIFPTSYLADHFLNLSYVPELDGSGHLRPVILLDGQPINTDRFGQAYQGGIPRNRENIGEYLALGMPQMMTTRTIQPGESANSFNNPGTSRDIAYGNSYSFGAMVGSVSSARVLDHGRELQAVMHSTDLETTKARTLSLVSLTWMHRVSVADENLMRLLGVRYLQEPSLLICELTPTGQIIFDIHTFGMALAALDGRENRERAFLFMSSMTASYFEHKVLEDSFQTSAVSTMAILRNQMRDLGLQIVRLDKNDSGRVSERITELGLSQYEGVRLNIEKELKAGKIVFTHPTVATIGGWTGWGYSVWDETDWSSGHIISGGFNGGSLACFNNKFIQILIDSNLRTENGSQPAVVFVSSTNTLKGLNQSADDPIGELFESSTGNMVMYPVFTETSGESNYRIAAIAIMPVGATEYGKPISGENGLNYLQLSRQFLGIEMMKYEAIAYCFKGDDITKIYPMRITSKTPDVGKEIQINNFTWTLTDVKGATPAESSLDVPGFTVSREDTVTYLGQTNANGEVLRFSTVDSGNVWNVCDTRYNASASLSPSIKMTIIETMTVTPESYDTTDAAAVSVKVTLSRAASGILVVRNLNTGRNVYKGAQLSAYEDIVEKTFSIPAADLTEPGQYEVEFIAYIIDGQGNYFVDRASRSLYVNGGCGSLTISTLTATPQTTQRQLGTFLAVKFNELPPLGSLTFNLEGTTEHPEESQPVLSGIPADTTRNINVAYWDLLKEGPGGIRQILPSDEYHLRAIFSNATCFKAGPKTTVKIDESFPPDGENEEFLSDLLVSSRDNLIEIPFATSGQQIKVSFKTSVDPDYLEVVYVDSSAGSHKLTGTLGPLESGRLTFLTTFPPSMPLGSGSIKVIAFKKSPLLWDVDSVSLLANVSGTLAECPDTASCDNQLVLVPMGPTSANGAVWWPSSVAVALIDKDSGEIQSGLVSLTVRQAPPPTKTEPNMLWGGWKKDSAVRASDEWIVTGLSPFNEVSSTPGGHHNLDVTAYAVVDDELYRYTKTIKAMVGKTPFDEGHSPALKGTDYSFLAPNLGVKRLTGGPGLTFENKGANMVRLGLTLAKNGVSYGLYGAQLEMEANKTATWFWKGMLGHSPAQAFNPTPKELVPLPNPLMKTLEVGTLSYLFVDDQGNYFSEFITAELDGSKADVEAVSDIKFTPWSERVNPSTEYAGGVQPYESPVITFRVNVPGTLKLFIIKSGVDNNNSDGDNNNIDRDVVKILSWDGVASKDVGTGYFSNSWDLTGNMGLIVPAGTYKLRAVLTPFQGGEAITSEGGSFTVRLNAEDFANIGKKRGKAFFGSADLSSGNKFLQVNDISIPVSNQGIRFTRYYNSRSVEGGVLGVGWRHEYMVSLSENHGGNVSLTWGHGGGETFVLKGSVYECEDSLNRLKKLLNGTWEVTTPDTILVFDEGRRLTSGWGLDFEYTVDGQRTLLQRVSDNHAEMVLHYYSDSSSGLHLLDGVQIFVDGQLKQSATYSYENKNRSSLYGASRAAYLKSAITRHGDYSYVYEYQTSEDRFDRASGNTFKVYTYAMTKAVTPQDGTTSSDYESVQTLELTDDKDSTFPRRLYNYAPRLTKIEHTSGRANPLAVRGVTTYGIRKMANETIVETHTEDKGGKKSGKEHIFLDGDRQRIFRRDDARETSDVTTYAYDAYNRQTLVEDGAHVKTERVYEDHKERPKETYIHDSANENNNETPELRKGRKRYTYYNGGEINTVIDALGNITTYSQPTYLFDVGAQVGGKVSIAAHRALGKKTEITDPENRVRTMYEDADGRLVMESTSVGGIQYETYYEHDERDNLTKKIDPTGAVTTYEYNQWDRRIAETREFQQDGATIAHRKEFSYDIIGNLEGEYLIDAGGGAFRTATYTYDGGSRMVSQKDGFGKVVVQNVLNPVTGWVDTRTDVNGNLTSFDYHLNGWVYRENQHSGSETFVTTVENVQNGGYSKVGEVLERTDPMGGLWRYQYDEIGRTTRQTDPTGRITAFTYPDYGKKRNSYAGEGEGTLRQVENYNEAGWVSSVTTPYDPAQAISFTTNYRYDERGNRTREIDHNGNAATSVYSAQNQLLSVTDHFGERKASYTYDSQGRLISETARRGLTTLYTYDERHRVARKWDAKRIPTTFAYDQLSRVTGETRALTTQAHSYDGNGNRILTTDGLGNARYFVYDDANRLRAEVAGLDAGTGYTSDVDLARYKIDAEGQITHKPGIANGKTMREQVYDELGRVYEEIDANANVTRYTYYSNDWIKKEEHLADGSWSEYRYNPTGIKTSETKPNGSGSLALETTYTVNALNQIEAINHPDGRVETFTYLASADPASQTDRSGVTRWFDYDANHNRVAVWQERAATDASMELAETVSGNIPFATGKTGALTEITLHHRSGEVSAQADARQIYESSLTQASFSDPGVMGYTGTGGFDYAGYADVAAISRYSDCVPGVAELSCFQPRLLLSKTDPLGNRRRYEWYEESLNGGVATVKTDRLKGEYLVTPAGSPYLLLEGVALVTLTNPQETTRELAHYSYDQAGNVLSTQDGDGRITRHAYDELNRRIGEWLTLSTATDQNKIKTIGYDGAGNQKSFAEHGISGTQTALWTTTYDWRGNKLSTVHPDGAFETWTYNKAGLETSHLDANGNLTRRIYDGRDRLVLELALIDDQSKYLDPEKTPQFSAMPLTFEDPEQPGATLNALTLKAYGYTDATSTDLAWEKDAMGTLTEYTYTAADLALHRPSAKTLHYTAYGQDGGETASLATWGYKYDPLGKVGVETDPTERATATLFDGTGRERKKLRTLDQESGYTASAGSVHGVSGLLAQTIEYDAAGNKVRTIDAKGIESTAVIDPLGRPAHEHHGGVRTASYWYEAGGNKLKWIDGVGNVREYEHDTFGNQAKEYGYLGGQRTLVRETAYDRQKNLLVEKDAGHLVGGSEAQNVTRNTYNLKKKLVESRVETGAGDLVTSYAYDPLGNKTGETSPMVKVTAWHYDELSRLVTVDAPGQGTTKYYYDPAGNLARIEDALYTNGSTGHLTTIKTDQRGNRVEVSRYKSAAVAITEKAGYDPLGNLAWKKDGRGLGVSYLSDEFSKVKGEARPVTDPLAGIEYLTAIAYQRDANLNPIQITETIETSGEEPRTRAVVRTWDDFNRLTTEAADGKTTTWSYDADGRRTGVAIPDGAALAYAYDGLGRLVTMTDGSRVTTYTLNKNGLLRDLTQPDQTSQHWEYRRGGREATAFTVKNSGGVAIRSQTYTYDSDSNRLTETDISTPRATTLGRTNTYDAAGRLKTTTKTETGLPAQTATYTYDLLGNRVGEEIVRAGTTVTQLTAAFDGANQLTGVTGTRESAAYSLTYAYDAAGNLSTASDGRSYAYDPAGKMVRDQKAGVASAHLYNWEGRRTASVTGAASVAYIHDGRSLLVEYLNGSVSRSYHYGERLTGVEAGAAKYGLHLDPLGSVVEVTGDAGPDCARTYDPWGEYSENGPCAADPKLAFTGHEYDQTSGLYNFGARYYDPATARFTTLDPYFGDTSTPPSLHKYLYAYANPYRWVDLEGYVSKYFQELLKEKFGDVQDYTSEHMQFIIAHSEQMQARNDARANRSVTAHHIEFEHLDSDSRTDVALAREGYYQQNELLYRANKHGSEIVAQIKADTAPPDIDPVDIVAGVAAAGIVQSGKNVIRSTVLKNIEASQSARRGPGFSEFIKREGAVSGGGTKTSLGRPLDSTSYSVANEGHLLSARYQASDATHIREWNRQLYQAFEADPQYAAIMETEFPGIVEHVRPGPRGGFADTPPSGLTWHHVSDRPGVGQLVPTIQHQSPGPVQESLHPGGKGGKAIWGGGRVRHRL